MAPALPISLVWMAVLLSPFCRAETAIPAESPEISSSLGESRHVLLQLYDEGSRLQAQGRLEEAESRFRKIVEVDWKDWEAHERLVQIHQAQGRKAARDARIDVLQQLYLSGRAWMPYFCRDVFLMGSKRVRALEYLERDAAGRETVLFMVLDLLNPGPPAAVSVSRSRETVKSLPGLAANTGEKYISGYELKILGLERPRTYFVPFRKPGYSDMKNVLAEIISGA